MEAAALIAFLVGAAVFLFGWFGTIRHLFAEDRALGYAAMLGPWILSAVLRHRLAGLLFPAVTLPYSLLHRDELAREMWFQIAGLLLVGVGAGLQHLAAS